MFNRPEARPAAPFDLGFVHRQLQFGPAPEHGLQRSELPFLLLVGRARNQHRISSGARSNIGSFPVLHGVGRLIGHGAIVQEISYNARLDCKIDVLGQIAGSPGNFQGIQFRGYYAHHVSRSIEKRTAAVAGLHCRADLQITRVIEKPLSELTIPVVTVKSDVSSP